MQRLLTATLAAFSLAAIMIMSGCGDKSQQLPAAGTGEISPQYASEIKMYEQTLAADPNNFDILVQLGNRYFDWGESEVSTLGERAQPVPKWEKGIDYYRRALEINPSDVNVRTDMGILLGWLGRFDEAEKEFRTGIKTDPKHPQARINLIVLLGGQLGRYGDAIKEYDALLNAAPEQKNNASLFQTVTEYKRLMTEAKR